MRTFSWRLQYFSWVGWLVPLKAKHPIVVCIFHLTSKTSWWRYRENLPSLEPSLAFSQSGRQFKVRHSFFKEFHHPAFISSCSLLHNYDTTNKSKLNQLHFLYCEHLRSLELWQRFPLSLLVELNVLHDTGPEELKPPGTKKQSCHQEGTGKLISTVASFHFKDVCWINENSVYMWDLLLHLYLTANTCWNVSNKHFECWYFHCVPNLTGLITNCGSQWYWYIKQPHRDRKLKNCQHVLFMMKAAWTGHEAH